MALVLTHNAPEAVAHCVDALRQQTRPPDRILVIDNASVPPVGADAIGASTARSAAATPVEVLRFDENLGPAGGHARGLRSFLDTSYRWAWILDDDITPEPDALERLLAANGVGQPPALLHSTTIDSATGDSANTQGWCGVLVAREIVETVGVPNEELFWWTEDTEYLQWRIPRAGYEVHRVPDAVVRVSRSREGAGKPAWKFYYETRNQVYHRLWVQRPGPTKPVPRHLRVRVRTYRAAKAATKLFGRALFREHDRRIEKARLVLRGAFDGVRGRLGRTIPADEAHRPVAPSRAGGSS
jgi:hypothetical protein